MKSFLALCLIAATALFAGCATTGGTPQTPQQVLQAYCNVSTPEIAAFNAAGAVFTPTVQAALKLVTPLNATLCSTTSIAGATPADVQTYIAQILPAITTIAIEFAAAQKANAAAVKSLPAPAPILGVQ